MFKIRKVMAIILALAMTLSMFNVGIVAADTGATDETATGGGTLTRVTVGSIMMVNTPT